MDITDLDLFVIPTWRVELELADLVKVPESLSYRGRLIGIGQSTLFSAALIP